MELVDSYYILVSFIFCTLKILLDCVQVDALSFACLFGLMLRCCFVRVSQAVFLSLVLLLASAMFSPPFVRIMLLLCFRSSSCLQTVYCAVVYCSFRALQ